MNPAEISDAAFVAQVLTLYLDLPDTPVRPSPADQSLARDLFVETVPPPPAASAPLLAPLRAPPRAPALPPLSKIRSLGYFLPVIEELKLQPLPNGYLDYLRLKLRRLSAPCSEKYVF
mgnify:CR=1 FL=1